MKDYEGFVQMNESTSELTLLSNLYSFYLQKYSKKIAKTKFKEQVIFLEEQGEVSKKTINKFFKENDIAAVEEQKKRTPKKTLTNYDYGSDVGCGSISSNVGCGSVPTPTKRSSSSYGGGCGSISSNTGC